nr:hypothetical protein [Cupriavidus sp. D39]
MQKALDDVAEIFIKVMRKLETLARTRLQQYQLAHADTLEDLVRQFRDVLQVLVDDGIADIFRLDKVRELLGNDAAGALARCNEHIAYAGNFDLPFMLAPYRQQRSLLLALHQIQIDAPRTGPRHRCRLSCRHLRQPRSTPCQNRPAPRGRCQGK